MKKKQLAAVLVLGMVCTLITTVPVCAQETKDTGAAHTIACLGDSITYGFVKDPTTGEESGTSYPMDLNILLGDDYNVVNLGKPGLMRPMMTEPFPSGTRRFISRRWSWMRILLLSCWEPMTAMRIPLMSRLFLLIMRRS